MKIKYISKSKFIVIYIFLLTIPILATNDPFSDLHVLNPLKEVEGSWLTNNIQPELGTIPYLEKINNNLSHQLIRAEGWFYTPEKTSTLMGSINIISSVIKYPDEKTAKYVVDTIFSDDFVKKFNKYKDKYNHDAYEQLLRESKPHSTTLSTSVRHKESVSEYKYFSHFFDTFDFFGSTKNCNHRQVIKKTVQMYKCIAHSKVVKSPKGIFTLQVKVDCGGKKILESQSYFRMLQSGAYIMVIGVTGDKVIQNPKTNKYYGNNEPPYLLEKYWQIINYETQPYICSKKSLIRDSDGDGVPDDIDICCTTPEGVKVDSSGCSECIPGEIYDPSSIYADFLTGCSPKVAVMFTTNKDPELTWRHQLLIVPRYVHMANFFRSKGYIIISVELDGQNGKDGWKANINQITEYLIKPSTKAIAYFGHGGRRIEKIPFWWDSYSPTLGGYIAADYFHSIYFKAKDFYKKQYCLSAKKINSIAQAKAVNIGLDYAYIFACHSLDNDTLRMLLVSPTGIYWGEPGILTGTMWLIKKQGGIK